MNKELKEVLDLQEIDKKIDALKEELEKLPAAISEKREAIQHFQSDLEGSKGQSMSFQVKRKEKEKELAAAEEKIKKHEGELNSVKSNEAYRALLNEIAQIKKQNSAIEEEILVLMDESEKASQGSKELEGESKKLVTEQEAQIKAIEAQIAEKQKALDVEMKNREAFTSKVNAEILSAYQYIREKKKGVVIVYIEGDCCGGCNTTLTPSAINEAKKGKELVRCDDCSRILIVHDYDMPKPQAVSEPAPAAPASPTNAP